MVISIVRSTQHYLNAKFKDIKIFARKTPHTIQVNCNDSFEDRKHPLVACFLGFLALFTRNQRSLTVSFPLCFSV